MTAFTYKWWTELEQLNTGRQCIIFSPCFPSEVPPLSNDSPLRDQVSMSGRPEVSSWTVFSSVVQTQQPIGLLFVVPQERSRVEIQRDFLQLVEKNFLLVFIYFLKENCIRCVMRCLTCWRQHRRRGCSRRLCGY